MKKIYSKIDPKKLLHVIFTKDDFCDERIDIINPNQFIQCAAMKFHSGKTFRPHKHIWKGPARTRVIAQESWLIIQGSVKCLFFDLDDSFLSEEIIKAGDASFTLEGGHNYEILEDNTLIYEYKTGPYEGVELDKVFLQ